MKSLCQNQKGAALPFVLLIVALNVTVIVAMLIYATTELQASKNAAQSEAARSLAQSGLDLAAGLIAANSTNNGFVSYQRVTNVGGDWRLETKIANVTAPDAAKPWKTTAATPAVLHSGFTAGTDSVDLNYAADADGNAGFIAPRMNAIPAGSSVSPWTNLSANMFRMDWIYVYKGDTNQPTNLIGRVAYWVDDESSKLNINYSGKAIQYSFYNTFFDYDQDAGKWTDFRIYRPYFPATLVEKNFSGKKWPYFVEFGGVAGLTRTNAFTIITNRGEPKSNGYAPYPSVLAVRIATNTVITNLLQQSELGFTATIYSKEGERSYATGRKRYDLLNLYPGAPEAATLTGFQAEIVANYPEFTNKYNLPDFASAAYSAVQEPGYSKSTTLSPQSGKTYGSASRYTRGLPLINELSVQASVHNDGGTTNVIDVKSEIELILLGQSTRDTTKSRQEPDSWAYPITNKAAYVANLSFLPANTTFGSPLTNVSISAAASSSWFKPNLITNNDFGPRDPTGSSPTNLIFSNSLASISTTNSLTNTNALAWVFPTNVTVSIKHNDLIYQTLTFAVPFTAAPVVSPVAGTTNIVYHLVAQPDGDANSYRGDPRFGVLSRSVVSDPAINATNSEYSIGSLNLTKWQTDAYRTAENQPDIMPTSLFFGLDYGIPQYVKDKQSGLGPSFAGVGWLGEVSVTTRSGAALAWSTPRLWGNGREVVNGENYPPDWLLLDCFHMAVWPEEPESVGSSNLICSSYGTINLNTAKSFFQIAAGSTDKSDTILDAIILGATSKDFTGQTTTGTPSWAWELSASQSDRRKIFLSQVTNMVATRNNTNNPYTTHYEFLADLAATNMPSADAWHPSSAWWPGPDTSSGSIYGATNTTDRRIEGIVRSLVQKLTTHGNQFSVFSLGQALQVTSGGQTNVVGEAYLQAVYERAPLYDETTGAITNGSPNGAPPMRLLYMRELR
jgi:hypothetical protein